MVGFELGSAFQIGALRHVAIGPIEKRAENKKNLKRPFLDRSRWQMTETYPEHDSSSLVKGFYGKYKHIFG